MQLVMWQSHQVMAGRMDIFEAWFPHVDTEMLERIQAWDEEDTIARLEWIEKKLGPPYTFEDLLNRNSCDIGIELTDLSGERWEELYQQYYSGWAAPSEEEKKQAMIEGLYKKFGLDRPQ